MYLPFDTRRTVFIHDFDGVHYRFYDHHDPHAFFVACAVEVVTKKLPSLTSDNIAEIYMRSIRDHGIGHTGFLGLVKEQDQCANEFTGHFSRAFHAAVYKRMRDEFPQWAHPNPENISHFQALEGKVKHGLLTMGDVDVWAKRFLEDNGTLEFFDKRCLLGFEDCGRRMKSTSPYPLGLAMARLGATPDQTVFIEDSPANLKRAKASYPEVFTVLVGKRYIDIDQHFDFSGINMCVPNLTSFLREIVMLHTPRHGMHARP